MGTRDTPYAAPQTAISLPAAWYCAYCGSAGNRPVTKLLCAACLATALLHPGCARAVIRNRTGVRCPDCQRSGARIPPYVTYRLPGTRRPTGSPNSHGTP